VTTPAELVSLGDVARMAGVLPSAVSNWRHRSRSFPEPWGTWGEAGGLALWLRVDVETWLADREAVRARRRAARVARLEQELANLTADTRGSNVGSTGGHVAATR
jgi:transcriptional regulator with XRE-family HTH domain